MNFLKILNEAIPLSIAKKQYTKSKSGAYTDRLNDIFKGKDRLIFDVDFKIPPKDLIDNNPLIDKIEDFLNNIESGPYTIDSKSMDSETSTDDMLLTFLENYKKGICFRYKKDKQELDTKNVFKIGKLLEKYENEDIYDPDTNPDGGIEVTDRSVPGKSKKKRINGKVLLHAFKNDPMRQEKEKMVVVISRHPYDIAGMSTDRNWTSCMSLPYENIHRDKKRGKNVKGIHSSVVKNDIKEGSIVAYLVNVGEKMDNGKILLRRPLSRILFRPFESENDDIAYGIGPIYGIPSRNFYRYCKNWIATELNKDVDETDTYYAKPSLYGDDDEPVNFRIGRGNKKQSLIINSIKNNLLSNNREELFDESDSNVEISNVNIYENYYSFDFFVKTYIDTDSKIDDEKDHIKINDLEISNIPSPTIKKLLVYFNSYLNENIIKRNVITHSYSYIVDSTYIQLGVTIKIAEKIENLDYMKVNRDLSFFSYIDYDEIVQNINKISERFAEESPIGLEEYKKESENFTDNLFKKNINFTTFFSKNIPNFSEDLNIYSKIISNPQTLYDLYNNKIKLHNINKYIVAYDKLENILKISDDVIFRTMHEYNTLRKYKSSLNEHTRKYVDEKYIKPITNGLSYDDLMNIKQGIIFSSYETPVKTLEIFKNKGEKVPTDFTNFLSTNNLKIKNDDTQI